jgi:ABC-type multidrug transport system fused ATPase/permease subunit
LMIAHRLATVQRAERICVIEDGRLVEQGAPADLVAAGGRFAELSRLQRLAPEPLNGALT